MWNYSFLIPSLLMLATLLFFYFTRPRLSIRINRMYVVLLVLEMLIIGTDILSSRADENAARYSLAALYAYNTAFFALFLLRGFTFFLFSAEVLGGRGRRFLALMGIPFLVSEGIALSSFATGWVFFFRDGAYQRGALYGILYYCYLFYILASLAMLLRRAERMEANERVGYLGYNLALLAGTVLRRMFPQTLLMSAFTLVAVLIIYMTFENPDLYLSDMGQLFNMRGLTALLNERTGRRDDELLGFVVKNYNHERGIYGGAQMDAGIIRISRWLRQTFPGCLPFYLRSGRFVLVGAEGLNWPAIRGQVEGRFRQPWDIGSGSLYLSVGFAELKPQPELDGADRIISNLMTIALELVGRPDTAVARDAVMGTADIQALDEQVDILRTLERAIERGGVEVFLQPVMDSQTRTLVAAEALARIRGDDGRVIPPSLFIPIAEQNGYKVTV